MNSRAQSLKKALWQVPALLMLAGLLALGVNQIRPNRIALVGDWSEDARFADEEGQTLLISLEQARQLFEQNAVLFLDARPGDQYAKGHIQDALSLPWQEVDAGFMQVMPLLEEGKTIIAYCDGENCDLSHELALFLKDAGFYDTRVLVNGLSVWQGAGLPMETGGQRNEEMKK